MGNDNYHLVCDKTLAFYTLNPQNKLRLKLHDFFLLHLQYLYYIGEQVCSVQF